MLARGANRKSRLPHLTAVIVRGGGMAGDESDNMVLRDLRDIRTDLWTLNKKVREAAVQGVLGHLCDDL